MAAEQLNIKVDPESEATFRAYCANNNLSHREGFKSLIASGMGMLGADGPHPIIIPVLQTVSFAMSSIGESLSAAGKSLTLSESGKDAAHKDALEGLSAENARIKEDAAQKGDKLSALEERARKAERELSDARKALATQESLTKAMQDKAERLEADSGKIPALEREASKAAKLEREIEALKSERAHEAKELKSERDHLAERLKSEHSHELESALLRQRLELQEKHSGEIKAIQDSYIAKMIGAEAQSQTQTPKKTPAKAKAAQPDA